MGYHEQNSDPRSCPEFGAIFMSNNATKRECLRRRVCALPASQSYFVKQVKAGMILFLFEFERRELHGVFQACSDGAMNILPHAFTASGKQFPAQVEFTPMWYCHPLSEIEFRDAIRENYFSKYKFKFGLSEDQVQRLLLLFSAKRLTDQAPPRQLTGSRVTRKSGYSTRKIIRVVDNDRSPMSDQVIGDCDVENDQRPVISTMHHRDSLYDNDRAADDGRFGTCTDVGYEHKASAFLNECFQDLMGKVGRNIDAGECATSDRVDIEHNTGIDPQPPVSVGYPLGNFRNISNDGRFAKSDRLETEFYSNDGFTSTISPAFPSSFQFKVDPHAYASKHLLQTDSFVHEPTRPSSRFPPTMELRNSNVIYTRTTEDSIVTTTLPYDPDIPSMNCRGSSSLGFDLGCASLQGYTNHDNFAGNVLSSSNNQSFPSLLGTRRTTVIPDVDSGSWDVIPLSYSDRYEWSSRTSLPRHACPDVDITSEYCEDLSRLKPPLAPVPSEIRNNVRMSEHPSSYRTSPSKFPFLTFSDGYSTLLLEKHGCRVPEHENSAGHQNDVSMFKECQHHRDSFYNDNRPVENGRFSAREDVKYEHEETQHQLPEHLPVNMDYHEVAPLSPSACQNSEDFYPDRPKKRSSVFSRLALPPKACEHESYTTPGTSNIYRNSSVNEVMDMLRHSRYPWVKTRSKQSVKHHDNADKFRDKKQSIRMEGLAMTLKEMDSKPIPSSKENSSQKIGDTTFVDFKRRSAVRKNLEDGKMGKHCDSLETLEPVSFSKECRSQKTEDTTLDVKRHSVVRKNLEDGKVGSHCESLENVKPVLFSKENSSQNTENTTFVDFKCRGAVRRNLEDGKTGNLSQSLENNSASASQSKRRKLIRPNFCQSKSCDEGKSGDAQEIVIASSTERSVSKNAETIHVSVCHVNENEISHNDKVPNVVCQTAVEGDKVDNGSGSKSEHISIVSCIPSRCADESGKESSPIHGISVMTSVSCEDMRTGLEQDLRGRDIGRDGLFQNRNIVTHESSPNICEDNDVNGVAKNEFCNIEQINNLCPVRGEMSISNIN